MCSVDDIVIELEKIDIKQLRGVPKELCSSFKLSQNGTNPSTGTKPLTVQPCNILDYKYLTKDVLEITLESDIKFKHGDVFKVTPKQSLVTITKILDHLNVQSGSYILNEKVVDLIDSLMNKDLLFPKNNFLRTLAKYTNTKNAKYLLYLSSSQGKEILGKLKHLNLFDLLKMFDCTPPIELLLEFLPEIKPRYYSVCSLGENTVSFCFNLTGLCTKWMETCCIERLYLAIEHHQQIRAFYLPQTLADDVIVLICNGTGISPFIGLLKELKLANRKCRFIYGHRTRDDQLFKNEVNDFINNGTIVEFINCLSKEKAEFKYVQHSLENIGASLFDSAIMVCGSGPMGKGVSAKLIEIYEQHTKCTKMEAMEFWKAKRASGLLKEDLW